jgi:hypothetical protein
MKNEMKNVAKAIMVDIETIKKSTDLLSAHESYTKYPEKVYDINTVPYLPPSPFYNKETGLYFIYQRDIAKLNYKLSVKIYTFYDKLIAAENLRSFMQKTVIFSNTMMLKELINITK